MAADDRSGRQSEGKDPPREFPQTPPPEIGDWSWSLQMMMEIQKTVGACSKAIETLASQAEKHEEKLDRLSRKVDRISHQTYAAFVVLAIVGGVLAWILNAASDDIVAVVKEVLLQRAK